MDDNIVFLIHHLVEVDIVCYGVGSDIHAVLRMNATDLGDPVTAPVGTTSRLTFLYLSEMSWHEMFIVLDDEY